MTIYNLNNYYLVYGLFVVLKVGMIRVSCLTVMLYVLIKSIKSNSLILVAMR